MSHMNTRIQARVGIVDKKPVVADHTRLQDVGKCVFLFNNGQLLKVVPNFLVAPRGARSAVIGTPSPSTVLSSTPL